MVTPKHLLIVAPNWLGDAVMALPLVADVHRAWPDTRLTVAARRGVAPLFRMVDRVADVVTIEGGGGVGAVAAAKKNAETLHAGRFDAALLLPNAFLTAWVVFRAGIPERWGFRTDWRGRLLTRAIPAPGKNAVHQAEYYQALGAGLGLPNGPRVARITVGEERRGRARGVLAEAGLAADRRFVAMAPGAAYGRAKQWLPERFAEIAAMIGADQRMPVVLVGTRADAGVCRDIAARAAGAALDLSGRTDLETLAGVLSLAEAVVANDSGAMHLAAAAGTKVVAIFGATNEKKTAPLPAAEDSARAMVVRTDVWCRPCMLRECPIDHRCMVGVTARMVFDALAVT